MDYSSRLTALQEQVTNATSSVQAAGRESRAQLKKRIDQAGTSGNQAPSGTQRPADASSSKWDQMRADAAGKRKEIKARIDKRNQKMDANMAATDASIAEVDADAAIDQAFWAVENAQFAVLDAIDARANAEAKASEAAS